MNIKATIEVPGKVVICAHCATIPDKGVYIQGAIPGGDLWIDGVRRGLVVQFGSVDYETYYASGSIVDYEVLSTQLDVILDL